MDADINTNTDTTDTIDTPKTPRKLTQWDGHKDWLLRKTYHELQPAIREAKAAVSSSKQRQTRNALVCRVLRERYPDDFPHLTDEGVQSRLSKIGMLERPSTDEKTLTDFKTKYGWPMDVALVVREQWLLPKTDEEIAEDESVMAIGKTVEDIYRLRVAKTWTCDEPVPGQPVVNSDVEELRATIAKLKRDYGSLEYHLDKKTRDLEKCETSLQRSEKKNQDVIDKANDVYSMYRGVVAGSLSQANLYLNAVKDDERLIQNPNIRDTIYEIAEKASAIRTSTSAGAKPA